jgi:hypothetical protein
MRNLMLARIQEFFDKNGSLNTIGDEAEINKFSETEAMDDASLLAFLSGALAFKVEQFFVKV